MFGGFLPGTFDLSSCNLSYEANQTIFTFELAHPTFADSQSSPSEG
jgi:hypothetical protein